MCGIAGIIDLNRRPADRHALVRMCNRLEHRGPDDAGIYINRHAALGLRRLSIIDLSPSGHQPMSNEDASIWITFNGEITLDVPAMVNQRIFLPNVTARAF